MFVVGPDTLVNEVRRRCRHRSMRVRLVEERNRDVGLVRSVRVSRITASTQRSSVMMLLFVVILHVLFMNMIPHRMYMALLHRLCR